MARTRLAYNVANRRHQQLVRQQQQRTAAAKEQQRITATRDLEIYRPRYRGIKVKFLLPQTHQRKQVKYRGNVVRELNVRRRAVFHQCRKRVYHN